jgi:hypothetical protein
MLRMSLAALLLWTLAGSLTLAAEPARPLVGADVVFAEHGGVLAIEAEHFASQTLTDRRAWYLTTPAETPAVQPDGDASSIGGASGGGYLEVLPDTRRSHGDKLIQGENFSDEPGKLAVLTYHVQVSTPGVYHLWARAYTTTTEDNGLHFGLDGQWPATGRRWQTTTKNRWHWESKQRTEKVHTGVPGILTLSIDQPGPHTLHVSMREDGIALDKILLVNRPDYRPDGLGPDAMLAAGASPVAFPFLAAQAATTQVALADPASPTPGFHGPRGNDGDGTVTVSGELKQWHKVTLDLAGPFAHERDQSPNPFTDCNWNVTFTHESGSPQYVVPGYFAADGNAGETSAEMGTVWRAHLAPDKSGKWTYAVAFTRGKEAALDGGGEAVKPFDGQTGTFTVAASDKTGRDFRAHGRLQYVGKHHLQFAGTKEFFLKAGADAPETLLGYADFDGTTAGNAKKVPLKTYASHVQDWKAGDPTWKTGKGKGLIGALNYLAGQGMNACSFLTYNAGGDGENVWPFIARNAKLHYDCSKLDQWGVVFDHGTRLGLYLHFKLQEQEIDDHRAGHEATDQKIEVALDGGDLGPERKLYCRELVARFGHALALNWNLGEENTQSAGQQRDMIRYLHETDPYHHNIVVHTFPDWQDRVYEPLLGAGSLLTGASLQNGWNVAHKQTLKWVQESARAGRPWVVANDEQGPAGLGVPADPGYAGKDGVARGKPDEKGYTLHDVRQATLWGNLMAGGAGVEYYFGYSLPQNDLVCEDWRSREQSWQFARIALDFFREHQVPFWEMTCQDALVGNDQHDNSRYCLAKVGAVYVVYLPTGGESALDLTGAAGKTFQAHWFNPRTGGPLQSTKISTVTGGGEVQLGAPPSDTQADWVVLLRVSK